MDSLRSLPGETGEIVVGHHADDDLQIEVDFPSGPETLNEVTATLSPGSWIYYGRYPGRDNDGTEAVTITLPDAPGGTDPDHRLLLSNIAEAKLVMTDKLFEMARQEQEQNPIDDDETETVEYADVDTDDEDVSKETN